MAALGPDEMRAIERRAVARAALSASGIGAVIARRFGHTARVRISDGERFGWLELVVGDPDTDDGDLEAAVELRAGGLPPADRLLSLEALSPLRHPADATS